MDIAFLVPIVLFLLVGLVGLAIGNRGWSIGTIVAAYLLLFTTAGYLYLAARVAARDAAWAQTISTLRGRIAAVVDPTPDAAAAPGADVDTLSLDELERDIDRWKRRLVQVNTWRQRFWREASFAPVATDDGSIVGRLTFAANTTGEGPPPLEKGAMAFLFDEAPAAEGGIYLGGFEVRDGAYDAASQSHVLTVAFTGQPNDRTREQLGRIHEAVSVFDHLPVDRWVSFYRTDRGNIDAPRPSKAPPQPEDFGDGTGPLIDAFLARFEAHDTDVEKGENEDWAAVGARLASEPDPPGTFWATIRFEKQHQFDTAGNLPVTPFEVGGRAEVDLDTALALERDQIATIERVFRRRPMVDPMAVLYGSVVTQAAGSESPGLRADGAVMIERQLRQELGLAETLRQRLATALESASGQLEATRSLIGELEADLTSWKRDAEEATATAARFGESAERITAQRKAADEAIVQLGRSLSETLGRIAAEIDRVAPPPVP